MEWLFSYGTLQQRSVQQETFGRLLEGNRDFLSGYVVDEVEITDARVVAASGKRYHPILRQTGRDEDTVEGMVFEVSESELRLADTYEVDDYRRVQGSLVSGRIAWIYVAAEDPADA